ncbi:hypothetical protein N7536_008743 [Penicillium majusculum]|nr:hypothetical protein N7536_008743 [Penicillium majusculum]
MDEAGRDAEDSIGSKPRSPGAPAARVHPWTGALHLMTQLFHTPGPRNIHWPVSQASNSWLQAIIYGFAR